MITVKKFQEVRSPRWDRLKEVLNESPIPIDQDNMFFFDVENLQGPCIYILMISKENWYHKSKYPAIEKKVYIGQTDNLLNRLGQHLRNGKQIDYVLTISMKKMEDLNVIEPWLIERFNPIQRKHTHKRTKMSG